MTTGLGSVRELGQDLTSILNSFASMLEGVYFVDEALAESLAEKFSDRLRTDVRAVYADMAKDIAEALAKPPVKRRRRRRKIDPSDPPNEMSDLERRQSQLDSLSEERGMGVEELEPNEETSLLSPIPSENDLAARLENSLQSQMPTDRARKLPQASNWDTDNPTMRPIPRRT